jgi:transcriptional regulator with XRE-family HTH domain
MGFTREQIQNLSKEVILKSMGNRMREIRQARRLSQTELAEKLKCDQPKISAIEKGSREPNLEYLIQFAVETGTSVDYLLLLEDIMTPQRQIPDYPDFVIDAVRELIRVVAFSEKTQDFFKDKHAEQVLKGEVHVEYPGQPTIEFD